MLDFDSLAVSHFHQGFMHADDSTHQGETRPLCAQTTLDPGYAVYEANAFTHGSNREPEIRSNLNRNIQAVLMEVEIPIARAAPLPVCLAKWRVGNLLAWCV